MTFDDMGKRMSASRTVTITGTRSVSEEAESRLGGLFVDYLQPFADPDAYFYLGGATGIDTAALEWLAEYTQVTLIVVVPCTVIDQPPVAAHAVELWRRRGRLTEVVELGAGRLDTPAYHARNRWMVDRSRFVIGFPRGTDAASGTWYTVNYAAEQGKPRLVVPV
jgi:predicted Rossmann fold nucleotide-binding protein DprA/Smf involved in DNA uptake